MWGVGKVNVMTETTSDFFLWIDRSNNRLCIQQNLSALMHLPQSLASVAHCETDIAHPVFWELAEKTLGNAVETVQKNGIYNHLTDFCVQPLI